MDLRTAVHVLNNFMGMHTYKRNRKKGWVRGVKRVGGGMCNSKKGIIEEGEMTNLYRQPNLQPLCKTLMGCHNLQKILAFGGFIHIIFQNITTQFVIFQQCNVNLTYFICECFPFYCINLCCHHKERKLPTIPPIPPPKPAQY